MNKFKCFSFHFSFHFSWLGALVILALSVNGYAAKKSVKKPVGAMTVHGAFVHAMTLADLGYGDGLVSDELEAVHTLFFPVPQGADIQSAWLELDYTRSPLLKRPSNLRVFVNGTPRAAVTLDVQKAETSDAVQAKPLIVSLSAKDLKGQFVRVAIRTSAIISDDVCLDERMRAGFVHVKPSSSINYRMSREGNAIETFFLLLPHQVTVSLGNSDFTLEQFAAALRLIHLLESGGHEVHFERLPKHGDIILASVDDYRKAAANEHPVIAGRNIQLVGPVGGGATRALLINDPFTPGLGILTRRWSPLLVGPAYFTSAAVENPDLGSETPYDVQLSTLGLGDTLREAYTAADWRFTVAPQQMPRSFRPTELDIDVISTPGVFDRPVMFYAYVNGILLKVEKLRDDGEPHRLAIEIPEGYTQSQNEIRLTALRTLPVGKCGADWMAIRYPVQVLPSSKIVTRRFTRKPENFADLSTLMQSGATLYLPGDALKSPSSSLVMFSRLMGAMSLDPSILKIAAGDARVDGPFVILGSDAKGMRAPVRFDQGKVEVRSQKNELLLDVNALPEMSVVQLAEKDGQNGLWISSENAEFPSDQDFRLTTGDIAFLGKGKLALTLDSHLPAAGRIEYPGVFHFSDFLYNYRWPIFIAAWALLTFAFLSYYRRSRGRRA